MKPGGQEELPRASRLFPDSGYALLQTRRPSTYLLLKYGPHGGGHGHPDKLSLILHAFGRKVSPDLGTPGYGIGLNSTWYRRTLSHNTVLIDGLSQPPATGRLNRFEARKGPGAPVADASVTWKEGSYKGVTMRRMVLLRADGAKGSIPPTVYFVDVFAVRCSRPRQMDWAFRVKGSGRKVGGGDLLPCPGLEGEGYEHLANLRAGRIADGARITWKVGKGYLDLFLVGGSELFVGDVPFNPASERTDMVISRRLGKSTVFVSVFCFREGRSFVTGVRENTKDLGIRDSIGLCVEKASGEDQWIIGLQSGVLRQ